MEADILKTSHLFSYRKILVHWPNTCKEFKVFQFPVVLCLKVQGSRDPCVGAAPVTELGSSLRKMEVLCFQSLLTYSFTNSNNFNTGMFMPSWLVLSL